jgi:DNA-binding transcriptional ArsR family regulator
VLRFLARHVGQSFYEQEIVERIDVSRSAVNLATRALHQAGLLLREQRGRMNFYAADDRHPFVRYFKVLDTIARLEPLLRELRPLARRIVLFGSCAEGTDTADSDVDPFILAHRFPWGPFGASREIRVTGLPVCVNLVLDFHGEAP